VTQEQLGLHPIDLVHQLEANQSQALGAVDDRILRRLYALHGPRLDRPIRIRHTDRVAGRVTWFELEALRRSLRVVIASRPLQPADLMRGNDARRDEQAGLSLPRSRVDAARADLDGALVPALDALAATLAGAGTIDAALDAFAATVGQLAAYRLPQTGTGFVYEWRTTAYESITRKIAERLAVWADRLADFDARITAYDALPAATAEDQRMPLLRAAEMLVRAQATLPPPATAAGYRAALDGARAAFAAKMTALQGVVDGPRTTLTSLLNDARAELPLAAFDPDDVKFPLEFVEADDDIARFRTQMRELVALLKKDVVDRIARVDARLAGYDAASATDRVRRLQDAAKIMFGDDFQLVPQIVVPAPALDELANAWQHSTSGALTQHLTAGGRDFPVDDWLHGVARVREKMHHWENVVLLGDALGVAQHRDLTPLQLPFASSDPWLALEIPDAHQITADRLLYTSHFAEAFDRARPMCGLVLDEWVEVIPQTQETTGIAFQYDRPSCESPQAWLLALPAVRNGAWSWDELLGAVTDALESAKRRAIEPVHIDSTAYSWFLPATVSAYTFPEISISNNLLRNVGIYSRLLRSDA
jgi:hypothetical protein